MASNKDLSAICMHVRAHSVRMCSHQGTKNKKQKIYAFNWQLFLLFWKCEKKDDQTQKKSE